MCEKNNIPIFPQSKQNSHLESMPNLGEFPRDSGGITQQNHVPRKGFRPEWLEKIMNLVPIILSMLTKPEYMQKGLWLSTEGAPRIGNPNVFELRPQGKTLEGKVPRKMGNLGFL